MLPAAIAKLSSNLIKNFPLHPTPYTLHPTPAPNYKSDRQTGMLPDATADSNIVIVP
jgi:hypothetical protein